MLDGLQSKCTSHCTYPGVPMPAQACVGTNQLSKLRTLALPRRDVKENDGEARAGIRHTTTSIVRTENSNGNASSRRGDDKLQPSPPRKVGFPSKRSLFQEHENDEDERGCMEAISAFLAAITHAADKQDSKRQSAEESSPPLLQTSKGAGTIECLDSARELLRFFGHSPLLHLEGVIWIKESGERAHCLAALSNWSLFLVTLRDPSFVGGVLYGFKKGSKNISERIVEIPLGSIVDVAPVSGREHLKTFRSVQANRVSRPFRIVTMKDQYEVAGPTTDKNLEMGASGVEKSHQILLVGFENICRLRHFLMLACESWAIRTGGTLGNPAKELLSCAPAAAQRYLAEVLEVMTGPLRDQVDTQVEVMEDLADEMILDPMVKEVFFSTGDIYFEIARRLEAAAAVDGSMNGIRRDSWDAVLADARLISAAAAVLDAAFFHSIQFPQKIDFVGRPKSMSLPVAAENLLLVYSALLSRIVRHRNGLDGEIGKKCRHGFGNVSLACSGRLAEDVDEGTAGVMISWDRVSTGVLDRVVRALNEMSDVVRLFNIENEHLGLVRNLVGVGLGIKVRVGVQPGASGALAFLVRVNDRAVGLIEDLDRWEQKQRQLEAARLLALGPVTVSPTSNKIKGRKRNVFARFSTSLSPSSRSRRSLTSPLSPESPANKPLAERSPETDNRGVGLQHLLEGGGRSADESRTEACVSKRENRGEDNVGGGSGGLQGGGRGGIAPPPSPLQQPRCFDSQPYSPRGFLWSAPVLLHSYAKLLNALVCGSYNLREAFFMSCEVDIRNIGREGGYLDILSGLDGGAPRMIFRQTALFLHEVASLFFSFHAVVRK